MSMPLDHDLLNEALNKVSLIENSHAEGSFSAEDLSANDLFMELVHTVNFKWRGLSSSATAVHLGVLVGYEYARLLQTRELTEGR